MATKTSDESMSFSESEHTPIPTTVPATKALTFIFKELINEMLVRELKRINQVVLKEDFYNFINAGNNVLRTLEENGIERGKKYLEYLVKNNIM